MSSEQKYQKSMNSIIYMSMRRAVQWIDNDKVNNSMLNYAHIPIKKDVPNWNQSSATWRHALPQHAFLNGKDSASKKTHI